MIQSVSAHVCACTNVLCTINFAVLGVGTKCSAWGCLASALPVLREELALQKHPGGAVRGALACVVCDSASCQHGGVWGSSGGAVGTFYAADVVASCCFYNCGNCGG